MTARSFSVRCFSCGAVYDALEATWCSCVATDRTLVCSHCLSCFCKAPNEARQVFWAVAPESLWASRSQQTSRSGEVFSRAARSPSEAKRPLVLIVDDEKNLARLMAEAVDELGYGFLVASDGYEGIELARRFLPDLVLTDALMPKLDGREMCRQLKEDPATAGIRVVVITGLYTGNRYRIEGMSQFRADEYLSKPIDIRELQDVLLKHAR